VAQLEVQQLAVRLAEARRLARVERQLAGQPERAEELLRRTAERELLPADARYRQEKKNHLYRNHRNRLINYQKNPCQNLLRLKTALLTLLFLKDHLTLIPVRRLPRLTDLQMIHLQDNGCFQELPSW